MRTAILALIGASVSIGAVAQSASPSLDVVTVTARKVEENLQTTPVAVTAMNEETIRNARLETFQDFVLMIPGASFQAGNFGDNQTLVLRGVQGAPDELSEPGFGLYRDGMYYGGSRTNFGSFVDVSSVEVLRGPQGALYGRNAVGGAVNINMNQPVMDEAEGHFETSLQDDKQYGFELVANTPIVEGKIAARMAAWWKHRGGGEYRNATLDENLDDGEDKGIRLAVKFTPSDNFDVTLTGEGQRVQSSEGLHYFPEPSYFNPLGETQRTLRRDTPSESRSQYIYFAGEMNYETEDLGTLTLVASYREYEFESIGDQDFTDFILGPGEVLGISGLPAGTAGTLPHIFSTGPIPGFTSPPPNPPFGVGGFLQPILLVDPDTGDVTVVPTEFALIGTAKQELTFDDKTDYFFTELRWASPADRQFRWVAGINFYKEDRDFNRTVTFDWAKSLDLTTFQPLFAELPILADQVTKSWSIWAEFTYDITDDLSIFVSGRYNRDKKDFFLQRIADAPGFIIPPTPPELWDVVPEGTPLFGVPLTQIIQQQLPDIAPQNLSNSWSRLSPGGGLQYNINDDVSVYARVNTGFRAGGFNSVPVTSATIIYEEEKSINYEIGLKSEFWDNRLRLNIALYILEQDDLLLFNRDPNDVRFGFYGNQGDARTTGVEIDMSAALTDGWTVGMAFGWLDPECRVCGINSGNKVAGAAEATLSLMSTYVVQLGNSTSIGFTASFQQRWGGFEDIANAIPMEDFSLLNLGITVEHETGWYGSVFVDNVLDEEYNLTRIAENGIIRLPSPQSRDRMDSYGMNWGVKLGYRF